MAAARPLMPWCAAPYGHPPDTRDVVCPTAGGHGRGFDLRAAGSGEVGTVPGNRRHFQPLPAAHHPVGARPAAALRARHARHRRPGAGHGVPDPQASLSLSNPSTKARSRPTSARRSSTASGTKSAALPAIPARKTSRTMATSTRPHRRSTRRSDARPSTRYETALQRLKPEERQAIILRVELQLPVRANRRRNEEAKRRRRAHGRRPRARAPRRGDGA